MRTIAVILGVMVIAAAAGVFAFFIWLTQGEIQENRYATYVEARESLDHGWLPTELPRSATSIHEWHNIDTNRCFGSFRFDPNERSTLESTLRRGRGFEFYSDGVFALAINWDNGMAYFWNSS